MACCWQVSVVCGGNNKKTRSDHAADEQDRYRVISQAPELPWVGWETNNMHVTMGRASGKGAVFRLAKDGGCDIDGGLLL